MYIRKTNHKTYPKHSNDEKLKMVLLYKDEHLSYNKIANLFNVSKPQSIKRWVNQYNEFGCFFETRGHSTKLDNPNKGRPRKYEDKKLEELSKEELIEKYRMLEDIKKSMAYLYNQKQKTNIK